MWLKNATQVQLKCDSNATQMRLKYEYDDATKMRL